MKHIRSYICKLFVALAALTVTFGIESARAQMPRFYTMEHGLVTTRLNSAYVDKGGLLWVTGEKDMAFFDGNRFHSVLKGRPELAEKLGNIYFMKQMEENGYLVGTGFGVYAFDSRTMKFTQISLGEEDSDINIPGYPVTSFEELPGDKGTLVTTAGFGSFVIDWKSKKRDVAMSEKLSELIVDNFVHATYIDSKGDLWVATSIEALLRIDTKTWKRKEVAMSDELKNRVLNGHFILCTRELKATGSLLFGAPGVGILIYDNKEKVLRETKGNNSSIASYSIVRTKLDDVFVGTDNYGIMKYDVATETLLPTKWEVPGQDLTKAKVHNIIEDKLGNVISVNYHKGVLIVPSYINKMTYIPLSANGYAPNSSPVSCFLQSGERLWVGTDGDGMYMADKLNRMSMHNVSEGLNLKQMTSAITDADGNVWAASYGGGIQRWDNGVWTTPDYVAELKWQNVLCMVTDKKTGLMYVCVNGQGLYEVDHKARTTRIIELDNMANKWVSLAYIDSKHNLWIKYATGLLCYNLDTKKAVSVDLTDIGNVEITDMVEMNGVLYAGTNKGMASYSYSTGKMKLMDINAQLPECDVMSLQKVGDDLWVGLSHSIACLTDKCTKTINYTSFPGFYIGELNRRSSIYFEKGFVCFGGDNGVVAISTVKAKDQKVARLLVTGFSVHGQEVLYDGTDNNESDIANIMYANNVKLLPDENTFEINFGSTEYAHSDELVYEYMLEGYESIWHVTDINNASAYYASVPSGNYVFRIRARYEFSQEYTETSVNIIVLFPWYATWWAKMLYLLLAIATVYVAWRMYKERVNQRNTLKQLQHDEQVKESKLRLFTSIAHELRTPLTMVLSPLKQLKVSDDNVERQNLYSVMQRNCDRLLNIVKQITDIRKIDNGQLHLHFSEFNFINYCNDIMESFSGIAVAKNIQFTLFTDADNVNVWADHVHLEKILINLIGNAFKFTPADGKILINVNCKSNDDGTIEDNRVKEYLFCSIYNSGPHIDEADLEHIYERFYQGSANSAIAGSGIGLNLCYELTKLHHGEIKAQNVEPDGVEFTVAIPLGKEHLTAEELKPRKTSDEPEAASNKSQIETLASTIKTEKSLEDAPTTELKRKKNLLIVDDDKEICEYMRSQLEGEYNITVCFGGNAAWQQVLTARPDVVVTDMKMPEGDGLELSTLIRQNPETAHIPIIMLTAENDERTMIDSVSAGVDKFLVKPFNIILLRSALEQVVQVRENLMNKVRRTDINHDYGKVEVSNYEDKFFTKINECVREHLDDSDFTVERLAGEVGVSRVHLNRKMKEHYGVSPNAFIRSMRLKQAAFLLVNNRVNVSEVAYKVGFASHSYFSNNFHEYFGMTPTEFVAYYSDSVNDEQLKKLLE